MAPFCHIALLQGQTEALYKPWNALPCYESALSSFFSKIPFGFPHCPLLTKLWFSTPVTMAANVSF